MAIVLPDSVRTTFSQYCSTSVASFFSYCIPDLWHSPGVSLADHLYVGPPSIGTQILQRPFFCHKHTKKAISRAYWDPYSTIMINIYHHLPPSHLHFATVQDERVVSSKPAVAPTRKRVLRIGNDNAKPQEQPSSSSRKTESNEDPPRPLLSRSDHMSIHPRLGRCSSFGSLSSSTSSSSSFATSSIDPGTSQPSRLSAPQHRPSVSSDSVDGSHRGIPSYRVAEVPANIRHQQQPYRIIVSASEEDNERENFGRKFLLSPGRPIATGRHIVQQQQKENYAPAAPLKSFACNLFHQRQPKSKGTKRAESRPLSLRGLLSSAMSWNVNSNDQ